MNRGRIKLTTLTYAMEAATENTVTKNALSGHIFKRFIKEKYDYLNPVSVKVKKNNTVVARIGGTQAYWEFVMETHKVFLTIQDKKDKDMEIRDWIYDKIRTSFGEDYRFEIKVAIGWPMTVEDVKIFQQKELEKRREDEEKRELEHKKRKLVEEENSHLDQNLRRKIMKKEMGTMEDFQKNMRNEKFDEQVRALWRTELNRKADVLMTYPFKELKTMQNERSEIERYISGVVPHCSGGDYKEPFMGNMDRVFRQTVYNICRAQDSELDRISSRSFAYDTLESCIRLYHKVHRDPEGCSIENLRLYSLVFVVE